MPHSSSVLLCRFFPWRSAAAGWVVAALALVLGVPLFLCMPPWNDVTLHDMAVRSILRGGVHYRDVFDTNLPGIDWGMAIVRLLGGWSYQLLRVVDLLIIATIVAVLASWSSRAGASTAAIAWFAAAAALFYPFSSEFNHMQRDPWLLLPAAIAARMRVARTTLAISSRTPATASAQAFPLWRPVLEGMVWGLAVWVKPHIVIPAAAIWLVSVLIASRRETGKQLGRDLAGLVTGGLIVGLAGVGWLVATGAWPYFLDVFLNWNPSYLSDVWDSMLFRFLRTFYCFRPWSIIHIPAVLLAFLALWEVRIWSSRPGVPSVIRLPLWLHSRAGSESIAAARALLAAFYLGWFFQATVLQKGMDYVQVPLLLLGMAMAASQSWAFGCAYLAWFLLLGTIVNCPALEPVAQLIEPIVDEVRPVRDPLTEYQVWRLWPRCVWEGDSPELRDRLGHFTNVHCGANWENLEEVAQFLRTMQPPLGDGELNCWHDSTHPLYLMLNLEPATRYMHFGTAFGIRKQAARIARDVAASRQRVVVTDLLRMTSRSLDEAYAPGADGDPHQLPTWFPLSQRSVFPWNQPIIFRSGRYLVHRVSRPLGEIDVPDWFKLEELGPGVQ